ncbi:nuclear transport factor 2 family protein [Chryseobacterium sp. JUb7]|uniref:nuclear transport factor 2 family protein n=1 Tax=Chryseobacterium sp. JUb7 TaxID=2940599 RepID=UPI00216A2DFF|nr:nuclear transport factor 2 family protein [Chryseobacterium sp. JUb7]MCS3531268.1 hypothetical protein [Chryseobacterium sp. JUb7]
MDNRTIEKLLIIEEIRNLRIKYAHALDKNDIETASLVFSEDAICQTDREPWNGRKEIKAGLEKAFKEYDVYKRERYPFLHLVSNHLIELNDDGSASGSCYLIDSVTGREPSENPLLLLGIYRDEYKKIDEQWFITSSALDVVWPFNDKK